MKIKELNITGNQGFSILEGINRKVIPSHVTKMANSIESMGIIRPVVVAEVSFLKNKSKDLHIIDGQHLYHACIRLGINVPYIIISLKDIRHLIETLAKLNNSSKSWMLSDYILAWQKVNSDYAKLEYYYNVYDLELSQVGEILHFGMTTLNSGGSVLSRVIKNGSFSVRNEPDAVKIMDQITDLLQIVPRMDRTSNKAFIASYVQFFKQYTSIYNHKDFIKYIKSKKDKFALATGDPNEFHNLFIESI